MRMRPAPFILFLAGITTTWIAGALAQSRPATSRAPLTTSPPAASAPTPDRAMADLEEFATRLSKLKDDEIEGRLMLARWARDREMYSQAADLAQAVLFRDPNNRAAYTILQQVDEARPMPDEPEVEESLKNEFAKRFGHDFKTRNSRHFVLCYDTTDTFAAQRAASMERVYDAFQFYFTMNTLRPRFLEHRLVVVLFKDRDDYLAYLQQTERNDLSWSAGFYAQRSNRSAFFDDSTGPSAASFTKQAAAIKSKIEDLNKQISAAAGQSQLGMVNQLTVERNRTAAALTQITNRSENAVLMSNNVKTMHEAAHQVAFNVGVQRRLVDYPLWFSEGLACSFETEDAAGRKGPAVLNYGRIGVIKDAIKEDKLLTVEQLVRAGKPEKDDGTLGLFYAQGWSLFHYLYKFERAGTEKYILTYLMRPTLRATGPDERIKLFTDAYGTDLEALNKKYFAYLKSLPARPN